MTKNEIQREIINFEKPVGLDIITVIEEAVVGEPVIEEPERKKYTQAHKDAQQRYRHKNPEAYCERQRKLYDKLKSDEEWKQKFNERAKVSNAKYREKKREEKMADPNYIAKKRGRPRK
jgi:hypothetical protein